MRINDLNWGRESAGCLMQLSHQGIAELCGSFLEMALVFEGDHLVLKTRILGQEQSLSCHSPGEGSSHPRTLQGQSLGVWGQ